MGAGVTLVVLGAILAFAVRADASAVDLQTVGLIFIVAGAAIIGYSRRETSRKRVVTHVEQEGDSARRAEVVSEVVVHDADDDGVHGPGYVPPAR